MSRIGGLVQQADDIVEKFIRPYLAKHHPNADIVIMAGSYGRAMKLGKYQPIASSDIDLVIIYSDLEKGGFKAATQIFSMEDVGKAMGGDSRIMMVDTNIHDFASLHYHDKTVRETHHFAFMSVMLDEGYILIDKNGVAPILQEKAAKFLTEGPAPTPRPQWQAEISRLDTFLKDIHDAQSTEEKRFLGLMCLIHLCEYTLGLNRYWRSGSNQAYRQLAKFFPEDEKKITDSFSALIRNGDASDAETVLEEFIARGKKMLPELPEANRQPLYPVDKFVPEAELELVRNITMKFMTEHLCEALGTSHKRGELAYLENLSATTIFIKNILEARNGGQGGDGKAGMRYLADKLPDMLPVMLQALDEKEYEPVTGLANEALSHMGGIHYTRLEKYYIDDVARICATRPANKQDDLPLNKQPWFKPGFNP
jgi:hypothetical protein